MGTASIVAEHEMSEVCWCPSDNLPSNLFLSLRHLVDGRTYGIDPARVGLVAPGAGEL